jgi:integrase
MAGSARTRTRAPGFPAGSGERRASVGRRIPLDDKLVRLLQSHQTQQGAERLAAGEAWQNSEGYVFTDELGVALHPEYVSTRFETLVKKAGVRRVRLHDLRHTAASVMLADGVSVKVVQELVGHSSPAITQTIYQHVLPGMSEEAGAQMTNKLLG